MRIIVTGGAGFIGSSFVHLLEGSNIDYLVVDKLTYAGNEDNLPDKSKLLIKDICDVTAEDLGEYDYLVNFAAESHVDNSIEDGSPFMYSNILGTFNLLELARKNKKLHKFIQISTDEVYGDLIDFKIKVAKETSPLHPSSYYSASKTAADHLVVSCSRTYNLPFIITRTCNNFGVRQDKEKFIPKIIDSIKKDLPIPVYGDGEQVREWIWVEDNVNKIFELMLDQFCFGIYNIGSDDRCKNIDIIKYIGKFLGKKVNYKFIKDRPGHDKLYSITSDRTDKPIITKTLFKYLKEQI